MKNSARGFFCLFAKIQDHLKGSFGNVFGFLTTSIFLKLVTLAEHNIPISFALIQYFSIV